VTQGQYVAAAYGVVFVFVLAYVAIIAAKLARLQRQTAELLTLVQRRPARREQNEAATHEVVREA